MSSTTTNYNLTKPAQSDFVDISVLNGNADTVDTVLFGKEEKATISAATMSASGWSGSEYSFEGTYPVATYNIEIQPNGDSITSDQMKAWNNAKIYGSATANKAIAKGTVPSIDIPIIVKAVAKNA